MDDSTLLAVMLRTWGSYAPLQQAGAPDTRLLRLNGVTAVITPATPDRPLFNAVLYEHPEALRASLDELAAAYGDAGIQAWTVWVHKGDAEPASLLEQAGHELDGVPMAMGLTLDGFPDPPPDEPAWSGDWDLAGAGSINDRAYGDPEGLWHSALGALPADAGYLYLARVDREPASFVLMHDHESDCGFWWAATIPEARGRGLTTALLRRALVDARDRGCTTSTTLATAMGHPIYTRLDYRDLGRLQMWERRR